MRKVLVVNGPNLNLLGRREPGVYGTATLEEIEGLLIEQAEALGLEVSFFQSNHEGAIVDKLHEVSGEVEAVVMNAGALTHYSYALRDAVAAIGPPVIEVHMSNVFAREEFRATSVIAPACAGSISGFGVGSYVLGLQAAAGITGGAE